MNMLPTGVKIIEQLCSFILMSVAYLSTHRVGATASRSSDNAELLHGVSGMVTIVRDGVSSIFARTPQDNQLHTVPLRLDELDLAALWGAITDFIAVNIHTFNPEFERITRHSFVPSILRVDPEYDRLSTEILEDVMCLSITQIRVLDPVIAVFRYQVEFNGRDFYFKFSVNLIFFCFLKKKNSYTI